MKVVPGDALLHAVHGAAARPRHAQLPPQVQAQHRQQAKAGAEPGPTRPARPASSYAVERPLPQAPQHPAPRGSALDITV